MTDNKWQVKPSEEQEDMPVKTDAPSSEEEASTKDSDPSEMDDVYFRAEESGSAPQKEVTSDEDGVEAKRKKKDILTEVLEYVKLILIVIVISLLITNYVLQRNTVKGESMVPTLQDGDELFVEKVSRYFGKINRFDIITVDTKGLDPRPNHIIKRVVGLPGETVEIKDNQVYINGEVLEEPFLPEGVPTIPHNPAFNKVVLAENEYYCLGDNRNNSNDSRSFGPVPQANIMGKLLIRFYPFDHFGVPR